MPADRKNIVKRQYLRAGCAECKRRKIKCDEVHPTCGTCARVQAHCVYPAPNHKNRPRRSRNGHPHAAAGAEHVAEDVRTEREPDLDMLLFENVFDDANTLVNEIAGYDVSVAEQMAQQQPGDMKPFHLRIILNQPHENFVFDEHELEAYLKDSDIRNTPQLAHLWTQFGREAPPEELNNIQITEKIMDTHHLNAEEREYFYDTAVGQGVYYIYPFAPNVENNEVMHVLLGYSLVFKYLVYALIAMRALCCFTSTGDPRHDRNQKKFTAICMRLLVAAFGDLKNDEYQLWNIEALILTVLVLTVLFLDMNFVDTKQPPVLWMLHLKDARLLLIKYNNIKLQSHYMRPDSPGITLAKLLFFCYEWFSKMSLPGAQISQDDLADLWLITGNGTLNDLDQPTLEKLGVVIPSTSTHNGFNLFNSLNHEVIAIVYKILDLIAGLNVDASNGELSQKDPVSIASIMASLSSAFDERIVDGTSPDNLFLIPKSNTAHPHFPQDVHRVVLPSSAYGVDSDSPDRPVYSYCDMALRLHLYFLYLKVLTSPGLLILPRSHPMIAKTVRAVLLLMFFLKPKTDPSYRPILAFAETTRYYLPRCLFDYRAIMIQLPFRLCIDLTDNPDDFEKLELFFKGLLKLGCGSCTLALKRIAKNREKARDRARTPHDTPSDLDYLAEGYPIF